MPRLAVILLATVVPLVGAWAAANDMERPNILWIMLEDWCRMVKDEGVAAEFRAGGWPATYPSRTLEEWEKIIEKFRPWVFHTFGKTAPHPRDFIHDSSIVNKPK